MIHWPHCLGPVVSWVIMAGWYGRQNFSLNDQEVKGEEIGFL